MKFGVIGALETEIKLIEESLEQIQQIHHHPYTFYKGNLADNEVILVCSSIGKVNAAVAAYILADIFQVDVLINTGIAGSLCKTAKPLDLVICQNAVYHDANNAIMKKYYPFMESYQADTALIVLCKKAALTTNSSEKIHVGTIATGDMFVENVSIKNDIYDRTSALCVEMEGAAIAQVAKMFDIPFAVIRTISDEADENASVSYDQLQDVAAKNSATITTHIIRNYQK